MMHAEITQRNFPRSFPGDGRVEPIAGSETTEQPPDALQNAVGRAQAYLLERQSPQGWWMGRLEADASVTAGYPVVMRFMGVPVSAERCRKVIHYCMRRRIPGSAWPAFHGGPPDLNVSIQVYFGLKQAGASPDEPAMKEARVAILSMGGIGKASAFTKIWLALFGQFDWRWTPSVPPEIIFLPKWFYLNIYDFASWSRQTIMALSVVTTLRPICVLAPEGGVEELYVEPPDQRIYPLGKTRGLFGGLLGWRNFFLRVDRAIKLYEKQPVWSVRKRALRAVDEWIAERQEADGGWGGIMLPWIYSLFAYKAMGHANDHPLIVAGLAGLETFLIEDDHELVLQPAMSPVWDTAWAAVALEESGLDAAHPALQRAGEWLLGQEVRRAGDWRIRNPRVEPGGWAFEFENDWYPDLDDSALVPRALLGMRLDAAGEAAKADAMRRARNWILGMQSKDGGWAAFDRDNDKTALYSVPFSEFMSPLDPTCADVTAHVIEMLAVVEPDGAAMARAIDYLKTSQQADGAWYGRWGVNYLYGTGLALTALAASGEALDQETMQRAVGWLLEKQNPDGGWGETCRTYIDPALRGCGPSTASQTAWVLIGLIAALPERETAGQAQQAADYERLSAAIDAGIAYLLRSQADDGGWEEAAFTGGGFPKVFYLRYDLYRIYFPLLALARYQRRMQHVDR